MPYSVITITTADITADIIITIDISLPYKRTNSEYFHEWQPSVFPAVAVIFTATFSVA
jgi:hypothetical protein